MGIFGASSRSQSTNAATLRLRFQTSLYAQPVPILHGQNRLAWSLGWAGHVQQVKGPGSGKGGSVSDQYFYFLPVLGFLCEGPIDDVVKRWKGGVTFAMDNANTDFIPFYGSQAQAEWGFLTAQYPDAARNYSYLAYVAVEHNPGNPSYPNGLNLGTSMTLPNCAFEVRGAVSCAVAETYLVASPYTFTPAYWALDAASVIETFAIPSGSPPVYDAQLSRARNSLPVTVYRNTQGGAGVDPNAIPQSASQGVIDVNGRVFTRMSSAGAVVASGQYFVPTAAAGYNPLRDTLKYTFYAGDIGLQVTIIDFALSPGVYYAYPAAGTVTANSNVIAGIASTANLAAGQRIVAPGVFPPGTIVVSVGANSVTMSAPALAGSSATFPFVSPNALSQVLGTPAQGEFSVSVQPGSYGQYLFAAADAGALLYIIDIPDASPADSITDLLTNPRYGVGLPAAMMGDLTLLTNWAYANGLFVSPVLTSAQALNSYLKDFSEALCGEFVWSSGQLTWVPYGDSAIAGNGKTYNPPVTVSGPAWSFDDDDYLKNEGTASVGISAFASDDPVVCASPAQYGPDVSNDVLVSYLDRGNAYNPWAVEAQDDAAIGVYGRKTADTKNYTFLCLQNAAVISAQLRLGRLQPRNRYTFTVPWYFVWLDPMDVVAISDSRMGLVNQWVRIVEIGENQQDGTLTLTVEDYLAGSATAPAIATQGSGHGGGGGGDVPDAVNPPILFEPPPAYLESTGVSGALLFCAALSGGSGGIADPNWGGAYVWLSLDGGTSYTQIGTAGLANMGVLTALLPAFSGTNPDTADTLAIDMTESAGTVVSASGDNPTLCYVDGELIGFATATLVSGNMYDLTTLYRGQDESCPDAHASGAGFAVMDGNIFKYQFAESLIGTTVTFKFQSFDVTGNYVQELSACTAYPYTVTGNGLGFSNSSFMNKPYHGASISLGNLSQKITDQFACGDLSQCITETLALGSLNSNE